MSDQEEERALELEVKALQRRLEDKGLYCICLGRDDGSFMICCDKCENWFHGRCVNIREKEGKHIDKYVCPNCSGAGKGHTTYKGLGKRVASPDAIANEPKRQRLGPSREERREKALEEARRRHEERQRQDQLKEAERLLEMSEVKKRRENDERQKRNTIQSTLRSALDEGLKADREHSAPPSTEGNQTLKKAEVLAQEIEQALYDVVGGFNSEYMKQYRTLVWNLRDKKNTNLRSRVFRGELDANSLVRMDSQQLANKDLIEYRKEREKISFDSVYKRDDEVRIYKKTHKGIETMQDSTSTISAKAHELGTDTDGKDTPLSPEKDNKLRNSTDRSLLATSNPSEEQDPQSEGVASGDTLPASGPVSKVEIDIDLGNLQDDAFPDPVLEAVEPSPPSSPSSHAITQLPTWSGKVTSSLPNLKADFQVSVYHINGPYVEEHLPLVLDVGHRIALDELLHYLPKLDHSSSRSRTCVYFEVANKDSEDDRSQYKQLFTHLRKSNRGGVIKIEQDACVGVDSDFFKELYVFPLAASAHVPTFIGDDEYDRDLEDMLIGVFLTSKRKTLKPSSALRGSTSAPAYQYTPPAASVPAGSGNHEHEIGAGIGNSQIEDMDTADTDGDGGSSALPDPTNNNPHLHTEPSSPPPKIAMSHIPESPHTHIRSPPETPQASTQSPTHYNPNSSQNPAMAPPHAALSVGALKALRGILSKVTADQPSPWNTNLAHLQMPGSTGHWPQGDVPPGMQGFVGDPALIGVQPGFGGLTGVNPTYPASGLPLGPEQALAGLPMSHFTPGPGFGVPAQPMEHNLNPQVGGAAPPPFVGRGGGVRRGGTFAPRGRGRPYQ